MDTSDYTEKSWNFVFTFNNWQEHLERHTKFLDFDFHYNVCYIAFSYEIAPSTGTQHLHWHRVKCLWEEHTLEWIVQQLPAGIKWDIMCTTFTRAMDYCGKDSN